MKLEILLFIPLFFFVVPCQSEQSVIVQGFRCFKRVGYIGGTDGVKNFNLTRENMESKQQAEREELAAETELSATIESFKRLRDLVAELRVLSSEGILSIATIHLFQDKIYEAKELLTRLEERHPGKFKNELEILKAIEDKGLTGSTDDLKKLSQLLSKPYNTYVKLLPPLLAECVNDYDEEERNRLEQEIKKLDYLGLYKLSEPSGLDEFFFNFLQAFEDIVLKRLF